MVACNAKVREQEREKAGERARDRMKPREWPNYIWVTGERWRRTIFLAIPQYSTVITVSVYDTMISQLQFNIPTTTLLQHTQLPFTNSDHKDIYHIEINKVLIFMANTAQNRSLPA